MFKPISKILGLFTGGYLLSGVAMAQTLPLSENLINFNSNEGEKLLIESNARKDYFPLSINFVTQNNQAFCGVASIVMVLNSMNIPKPETNIYGKFRIFTQDNFFNNPETQKVKTSEKVAKEGMTLAQLQQLLESYNVKVDMYYGSEVSVDKFRTLVKTNLKQPNNFVLVNYLRKTINQESGGHISPIAAYNEKSDRFLILDVSRYKYPPVWVKTSDLWKAISTVDSSTGKSRGFVMISEK
ncbi:MAG TPA: phytochelatin synthase family protein [Allocoleopsis sp.]